MEKRLAVVIVKNAVTILVLPALSLIPDHMLLPQNAAINVIIATPLVHRELLLLIPALQVLIMNVEMHAKNVLLLALPAQLLQIPEVAAARQETNVILKPVTIHFKLVAIILAMATRQEIVRMDITRL